MTTEIRPPAESDPYRVLHVHPRASRELIDGAYWALIQESRASGAGRLAELRISELNAAYAIVSDAATRRLYDEGSGADRADDVTPLRPSKAGKRHRNGATKTNHYDLLHVDPAASPAVIEIAYQVRCRELNRLRADTPAIRDQLAEARRTLLDPDQREHYDRTLADRAPQRAAPERNPDRANRNGAHTAPPPKTPPAIPPPPVVVPPPPSFEKPPVIESAPPPARANATPSVVVEAETLISTLAAEGRQWAARDLPRDLLVEHSILPLGHGAAGAVIAVPPFGNADAARFALKRRNVDVADVYVRDYAEIREGLTDIFREQDQHRIVWDHAERQPEFSASRVLTGRQKLVGGGLITALVAALVIAPVPTLIAVFSVITAFYFLSMIVKTLLVVRALSGSCEIDVSDLEVAALRDEDLPPYTVLLPLYREAHMLPQLIASLEALDYPKDRLDVKLLLEEDDIETRAVAANMRLPSYVHLMVVPPDGPRGKPKACNYGLAYARGQYAVLYDAEDRAAPDQLKKALIAFRRSGSGTACVQAKLNFYNPDQNLLTKWFTSEYSAWFDLYLPGLNASQAPIPLGGTSNHFRTDILRSVGGWDAFNVTEDADLGVRLARHGFRTVVLDSVTYEEANSQLGNWMRQRSRWIKGYIHTWLVHTRHPRALWRDLGPRGVLAFDVMVFGTFFAYLVNPIFWALVVVWYTTHWAGIQAVFPAPLLYLSSIAFFGGNFLHVFTAVAGCLRRGYYQGVKYALLSPMYWAMMSVAMWKALAQLVTKPHYWEKTDHGLAPVKR